MPSFSRISSHPTRVRGLKYEASSAIVKEETVAPYTGAWIEINIYLFLPSKALVAPYTGAWIEILVC